MNPIEVIEKFYEKNDKLRNILLVHSQCVAEKALEIAKRHPELSLDERFIYEASMLHDIGIIKCDAPGIECFGTQPYICHGVEGAAMLLDEGLPRHALVCERHTGAGITLDNIIANGLPIPHRSMLPESLEEQVICFADKFFSKSHIERVRTPEQAEKSLLKFGDDSVARFRSWCKMFL